MSTIKQFVDINHVPSEIVHLWCQNMDIKTLVGFVQEIKLKTIHGRVCHDVIAKKVSDNNYHFLRNAIQDNNIKTIKLLLDAGMDPNAEVIFDDNEDNEVFLKSSMFMNEMSPKVLQLFINAGANINATDRSVSLLASKVENNDLKSMAILIDAGADVNAIDDYGSTPLFNIMSYESAKLLIKSGANVNVTDMNNFTPLLLLMIESRRIEISNLIRIVKLLIDSGANVNVKNSFNITPLHGASFSYMNGGEKIVQMLVDKGADVNAVDRSLETPLHNTENPKSAQILIRHGANIEAVNIGGRTPLNLMLSFYVSEMTITPSYRESLYETIIVLLKHGANVNTPNRIDGKSAKNYILHNNKLKDLEVFIS